MSGHTIFRLWTWRDPLPGSTWAVRAHIDLMETAFPTELQNKTTCSSESSHGVKGIRVSLIQRLTSDVTALSFQRETFLSGFLT